MSIFFSSISLAVTGGGGGARLNATWRSAQAFAVNICLILKFFSFACIEWGMECQTYILICSFPLVSVDVRLFFFVCLFFF